MSVLIKQVSLEGETVDVYIEGNRIVRIGEALSFPADRVIDGRRKAVIPGLVNGHTHAAMTLFRGFGDDMPLMPWLEQKICFSDMYHHFHGTAEAVEEMGLRGVISGVCFDNFQSGQAEKSKRHNERLLREVARYSDRIRFALGPHAIYTVSGELLRWASRFAEANGLLVHIHLAETEGEVADSIRRFGLSPVRYLRRLGVLSPRLVIAHGVYVDDEEIRMLADAGVKVVHNPASNMKLASGYRFPFEEMRRQGVLVGLGTDGCSSSNNLDMIEAMKLASLLGKVWRKDPEALSADEMLRAATSVGAAIFGIEAGRVAEGYLADLCLVDLALPAFTPNFNFVSNLVYAANGSCVDTVICDGKVLMEHKQVPGEEEIMEHAAKIAYELVAR